MPDTVVLPGTGTAVSVDDIAGIVYQRIKLIHGNDGVNDGDVSSSNPLPVKIQFASLDFGGATPNALDSVSVIGSESPDINCEGFSNIILKVEYSANNVTAPLWIVLKDSNVDIGRAYSVKVTPANTGEQDDIQETGYFHGEAVRLPVYGAKNFRVVLADTPTNSGNVSVWAKAI